jgi:hypothetical protein
MGDWLDSQALSDLSKPAAYPTDASAKHGIEWIQTHISHVFLSQSRVYKLRKPVDLGFVQFATRDERTADCEREVALNRRLAADVYLGIAPILTDGRQHWLGDVCERVPSAADPVEYCVVMRRLPAGRDALSLLEEGALSTLHLDRVAARMSEFHARHGLGVPAPFTAREWHARCLGPVEDNCRSLAGAPDKLVSTALLAETSEALSLCGERCSERFDRRRRRGRIVDGHGDLHLQHIWFEDDAAAPLIIDCLEFSDRLRHIDAASEVAFLAMDLRYRGHGELSERFLCSYARESDDFDLYRVVDFFISYRATVRAKVAAIAAEDPEIKPAQRVRAAASAQSHLELAAEVIRSRPPGTMVLVGGAVGTGKSTVAGALADELEGVVIASDRVRKKMAGLPASQHVSARVDEGLYAPDAIERVYQAVLERARLVVESGRAAILDATFGSRHHRAMAADLAQALGVPYCFVEVRCSPEIARERLAHRQAEGTDPSDAEAEFHATSVARFEPVTGEGHLEVIRTDAEGWRAAVHELSGRMRTSRRQGGLDPSTP